MLSTTAVNRFSLHSVLTSEQKRLEEQRLQIQKLLMQSDSARSEEDKSHTDGKLLNHQYDHHVPNPSNNNVIHNLVTNTFKIQDSVPDALNLTITGQCIDAKPLSDSLSVQSPSALSGVNFPSASNPMKPYVLPLIDANNTHPVNIDAHSAIDLLSLTTPISQALYQDDSDNYEDDFIFDKFC